MNINVTIGVTPQLEKVLEGLALLFSTQVKSLTEVPAVQQQNNVVPMQQPHIQHQAPVVHQQTVPTAVPTTQYQAPPVQQAPVVQQPQQAVPTSAPTYTQNDLAVAATQLVDAGRMGEVQALIASFGAQSLLDLPTEQYGAFATKLRELGAKI
ncbi:hypothetical protein ACLM5H_15635 [Fredinandcohnia humi]